MSLFEVMILISAVAIGGIMAFVIKTLSKQHIKLFLAFVGAYVLAISFLHLIPTLYALDTARHVGIWVMVGFLVQLTLEQLSKGIEHGHIHEHHHHGRGFVLSLLIGLCLHAFIEGLPLDGYADVHASHDHTGGDHLLFGIALHKMPAAFALSLFLLSELQTRWKIIAALALFAAMTPIGYFTGSLLADQLGNEFIAVALALVVGSFLHIATTILFETEDHKEHKVAIPKLIAIIFGILVAIFTT